MATDNLPVAQYTSAKIATTLEAFANKPQIIPQLRKSIGDGIYVFDIVSQLKGAESYVASETWSVHEELPHFRTMTIGDTVSGGATATDYIDFNLDTGDVDQLYKYYPRAGSVFTVGSAQYPVQMIIHSVTPLGNTKGATIRAYVKDSTKHLAASWSPATYIKTGQTFAISPAVNAGQGTAPTTPTHVGYQEFSFKTEVLKDAVGWENAEFARERWVELQGGMIYTNEIERMDKNMDAAMEYATWFGQPTTNASVVQTTLANSDSVTVPGTKGIWQHIEERGYDLDFTNTTDFTVEHLYEFSEYAETVGLGSGEWMMSAGGTLLRRIEKSCKSYITNATGSLNEQFTPDAGGGYKDLNVGFKSIFIGGQRIYLHPNSLFNNPLLFGISTYGLKDAGAAFPIGDVREGKGSASRMIPNISYVYRGLGDFKNRKRAFGSYMGMGSPNYGPVVLEGDISKVNCLTEWGLQALEMWRGVRIFNTDITNAI